MTQLLLFPALCATVHYKLDGAHHTEACDTRGEVSYLLRMCHWARSCGISCPSYVEWHEPKAHP